LAWVNKHAKAILFSRFILRFSSCYSYIEWEKYPDRCEKANKILTEYKEKFTPIPEFQVEY
jgi:hypothetical protein